MPSQFRATYADKRGKATARMMVGYLLPTHFPGYATGILGFGRRATAAARSAAYRCRRIQCSEGGTVPRIGRLQRQRALETLLSMGHSTVVLCAEGACPATVCDMHAVARALARRGHVAIAVASGPCEVPNGIDEGVIRLTAPIGLSDDLGGMITCLLASFATRGIIGVDLEDIIDGLSGDGPGQVLLASNAGPVNPRAMANDLLGHPMFNSLPPGQIRKALLSIVAPTAFSLQDTADLTDILGTSLPNLSTFVVSHSEDPRGRISRAVLTIRA